MAPGEGSMRVRAGVVDIAGVAEMAGVAETAAIEEPVRQAGWIEIWRCRRCLRVGTNFA